MNTKTKEAPVTNPDKYNGWTNRETWAFDMHLSNDEGRYNYAMATARDIVADTEGSGDGVLTPAGSRRAVRRMADFLESYLVDVREAVFFPPQRATGAENDRLMLADVGSVWRVNYDEIAKNWIDDAAAGDDILTSHDL